MMRNISDQVRSDDDGNFYVDFDVNELRDGTVVEFPIPASFHPLPLTVQFWMDENGEIQSKLVVIDAVVAPPGLHR